VFCLCVSLVVFFLYVWLCVFCGCVFLGKGVGVVVCVRHTDLPPQHQQHDVYPTNLQRHTFRPANSPSGPSPQHQQHDVYPTNLQRHTLRPANSPFGPSPQHQQQDVYPTNLKRHTFRPANSPSRHSPQRQNRQNPQQMPPPTIPHTNTRPPP